MLGICLTEKEFTDKTFSKPLVLKPGQIIKRLITEKKTHYFIEENRVLLHFPDPVYNMGETYYLKETYTIDPMKKTPITYKSDIDKIDLDLFQWRNRAQMPQWAARIFIKITACELVFEPEQSLIYMYKFEIKEQ
jgi:hypothetical protein